MKWQESSFNLFRIFYVALLLLGVWTYALGYNYFSALSGTGAPNPATSDYEIVKLFLTGFGVLFAFRVYPKWTGFLFVSIFFYYEISLGAPLKVYSTNIAGPLLILMYVFSFSEQKQSHLKYLADRVNPEAKDFFFKAVLGLIATVYFCSALSKVVLSNSSWFSGDALQAYFYESNLYDPQVWKNELLEQKWVFSLVSIGVLLWEFLFSLVLMPSFKIRLFFSITGILFHASIYYLFGPNFFLFFMPTYLVFLPILIGTRARTVEALD